MSWSTPLATSSVPRCSDIELIVLSLFLPPHYLSLQRGRHPFHATCLFSLLVLLPLQYRRTVLTFSGRPVVGFFFIEPSVSSEFTVVHVIAVSCPPHQDSILVCDQLTIIIIYDSCSLLFGFGEVISVS